MGAMSDAPSSPAHPPRVYRAASAPWLTGFLVVLGFVVLVAGWGGSATTNRAVAAGAAALAALGYALYWRPRLEVAAPGVRIVNPLRTVEVPWGRIVDVSTRFSVTLRTAERSYSSFALPAAGAGAALRSGIEGVSRVHPVARPGGVVRTGDLAGTASGIAANDIRTVWQRKIDMGELDVFTLDDTAVPPVRVRYAPRPLAVTAGCAALAVALFAVA